MPSYMLTLFWSWWPVLTLLNNQKPYHSFTCWRYLFSTKSLQKLLPLTWIKKTNAINWMYELRSIQSIKSIPVETGSMYSNQNEDQYQDLYPRINQDPSNQSGSMHSDQINKSIKTETIHTNQIYGINIASIPNQCSACRVSLQIDPECVSRINAYR